jgi:hypothetical protein
MLAVILVLGASSDITHEGNSLCPHENVSNPRRLVKFTRSQHRPCRDNSPFSRSSLSSLLLSSSCRCDVIRRLVAPWYTSALGTSRTCRFIVLIFLVLNPSIVILCAFLLHGKHFYGLKLAIFAKFAMNHCLNFGAAMAVDAFV